MLPAVARRMATMGTTSPLTREINEVLRDLVGAREEARLRAHLLSMDARRRLADIEQEIEIFERKLASRGDWVAEHVIGTARGLTRAIGELIARREPEPLRVREVMSREPLSCRPADSLSRAAQLMWDGDCGVLPVVDEAGKPIGIVTDRDICMAAYTRGLPLAELAVSGAMSTAVYTCKPTDSLRTLMEEMATRQVRRVPVVAEDGSLIGIVSLADIARFGQMPSPLSHDARVWVPGVLAGISEPGPANGNGRARLSGTFAAHS
jgi:CBS domain-containing protein